MHWLVGIGAALNLIIGRHLAFYVSIYLACGAIPLYREASGDNILSSSTFNPTLAPSLCILSVIGVFSIPWILFVQYVNAFAMSGDLEAGSKTKGASTLAAIIDLILGIWLWFAVQWQSAYIPRTQSRCTDAVSWPGPNGQVNIFQAFSNLEGNSAEDSCNELVGYWKLGVVLVVLTLFASLIEFFNGSFVGFVKLCWYLGTEFIPATKYLVTRGLPKLAVLLLRLIERIYDGIVWLAMKLVLFIPRRLAPPVRYRSRYWKRSKQKHNILPTQDLHLWRISPSSEKGGSLELSSKGSASNRNTVVLQKLPIHVLLEAPLIRLISCQRNDTILLRIIHFLHYTDVVNLSLLSKRVRSELFRSPIRVEDLRVASCIPAKFECYSCNMQICESCQQPQPLEATDTTIHLHNCVVHCSACYRKKICAPKAIHSPPVCMCSLKATKSTTLRSLCGYCSKLSDGGLEIREMREKTEIVHLAGQELKCGGCKRRLPSHGVRWWVCKKCGKECTNSVHPQWAKAAEP